MEILYIDKINFIRNLKLLFFQTGVCKEKLKNFLNLKYFYTHKKTKKFSNLKRKRRG